MADLTEIEALKASLRGARRASDALTDVATRVDMADSHQDVPEKELDELKAFCKDHQIKFVQLLTR